MRPEVRDGFIAFTARFEGFTDWLYCDVRGLVTVGYGDLVDPIATAAALDFVHPDGAHAGWSDVTAAWVAVKARQDLRLRGGGAYRDVTRLRATRESIDSLCAGKLAAFETILVTFFPDWEAWPGQAQQGALSMAWAMGPWFPRSWPAFTAACRAQDWEAAASACHIPDADNPGLRPRNRANEALFREAAGTRYVEPAEAPMVKTKNEPPIA